ncbi:MAG: hypothetical protein H6P95_382 [Candidatus Aminicenantes bacterium]|nr:hypothetical protein [Candidatus Aminicenantes bacterium]
MTADTQALAAQVLEALREIEHLIADLYRRFAKYFPKDRGLWEALSQDEQSHAAAADELKRLLGETTAPATSGRINLAALSTYRKGLEDHVHRLERGEINRTKALFTARDIEKTLVERSFYDLIQSDHSGFKEGQARVIESTRSHLGKLEEYIETVAREAGRS